MDAFNPGELLAIRSSTEMRVLLPIDHCETWNVILVRLITCLQLQIIISVVLVCCFGWAEDQCLIDLQNSLYRFGICLGSPGGVRSTCEAAMKRQDSESGAEWRIV